MIAYASKRIHSQRVVTPLGQIDLLKNDELEGRHEGERCFILGAGSSVAQQDLKKIAKENVISVSNTYVHSDFPLIRPQYHVLPPLLSSHGSLYEGQKFVEWLREMEEKTFDAEMFFHVGDKSLIEEAGLFRNRTIHWNEYVEWSGKSEFPINLQQVPSIKSIL